MGCFVYYIDKHLLEQRLDAGHSSKFWGVGDEQDTLPALRLFILQWRQLTCAYFLEYNKTCDLNREPKLEVIQWREAVF